MSGKFPNFVLFVLLVFFSGTSFGQDGSIWGTSPVGRCYKNIDEFLKETFGERSRDDENIRTYPAKIRNDANPSTEYVWVEDATPSVNTSRYLFSINIGKQTCAILFVPVSSSVKFSAKLFGGLPAYVVSLDTAPPGLAATQILQFYNRSTRTYKPKQCFLISANWNKKQISCDKVFRN